MFTCNCLNIEVQVPSLKNEKFDVNLQKFTEADLSEPFLQKDLGIVNGSKVIVAQKCLVREHKIGEWVVYQCCNCNVFTYGTSKHNASEQVVVDIKLLKNTNEIAALKQSDEYSTPFRMIINRNNSDFGKILELPYSSKPKPEGNIALRNLQYQFNEAMEAETKATEDRIKKYKEEQYAKLEAFKERSKKEHQIVARLALTNEIISEDTILNSQSTLENPALAPSMKENNTFNEANAKKIEKPKHNVVNSLTSQVKRSSSSRTSSSKLTNSMRESYDSEVLFPLDGMDDSSVQMSTSDNDSDTDDSVNHDDIQHSPTQRAYNSNLAKSLPMSVPSFMAAHNREVKDIDDDQVPEGPSDIAASMKALAKSVHGEAVFGDLPRPRLRTQI